MEARTAAAVLSLGINVGLTDSVLYLDTRERSFWPAIHSPTKPLVNSLFEPQKIWEDGTAIQAIVQTKGR